MCPEQHLTYATAARSAGSRMIGSWTGWTMAMMRKPATWLAIYERWLRAGADRSYAVWMADRWERRKLVKDLAATKRRKTGKAK